MKLKEWAEEDRPREKALQHGISSLSNAELLAILIGSGNTQESAVQLSQRILNSMEQNLNALGKCSIKELCHNFKGIGTAKAVTIAAALELGKRRKESEPAQHPSIQSSYDSWQLFYADLCDLPHEELWVAFINRAGKLITKQKISQGGISGTNVDLRLVLKAAIQALASGLIICHNHPSGNLRPSQEDDRLTLRLKEAAKMVDISLLDHIIVAENRYYSYADEEKL